MAGSCIFTEDDIKKNHLRNEKIFTFDYAIFNNDRPAFLNSVETNDFLPAP